MPEPSSSFHGIVRSARVELESLLGLHTIDGVMQSESHIWVGLDGLTYRFQGEGVYSDDEPVRLGEVGRFDCDFTVIAPKLERPIVAEFRMQTGNAKRVDAVLYAIDESTSKVVLAIGTINTKGHEGRFVNMWVRDGWIPKWLHDATENAELAL